MAAAAAGGPPPRPQNPFDSFRISVGGHDISAPRHQLANRAQEIKRHAWKDNPHPHDIDRGVQRGCTGVATIIDRLVNGIIMPNDALTQEGQQLAGIIGGNQANEKAKAFRVAAFAARSVNWKINQVSGQLTLSVPVRDQDRQFFAGAQAPQAGENSLILQNQILVLTLHYTQDQFLNPLFDPDLPHEAPSPPHEQRPFIGDLCQQAIIQVTHAIEFISQDDAVGGAPIGAGGSGISLPPSSSEGGAAVDFSSGPPIPLRGDGRGDAWLATGRRSTDDDDGHNIAIMNELARQRIELENRGNRQKERLRELQIATSQVIPHH